MDRKAIIVLVASFALILAWPKLINKFYPPAPKSTNLVSTATNQLTGTNQTGVITALTNVVAASTNAPEETITVTNQHGLYVFTSHGGGLKSIELRGYRA